VIPVFTGLGGIAYGFAAVVLGGIFMALAIAVWREGEGGKPPGDRAAKRLFGFSLLYLFLLFAVLLAEHTVRHLLA
jgi:protoheme IX farnesyltransferase